MEPPFLQAGLNYVLSATHTPASDVTEAILDSQNNYWTLNFSSGLVLDDKTDLNISYLYYLSGDYVNNSPLGVPYGAGSEEHAVTATNLKYQQEHAFGSQHTAITTTMTRPMGGIGILRRTSSLPACVTGFDRSLIKCRRERKKCVRMAKDDQ